MEALKEEGNQMLTANNSPAFKSTLSPTLDAFFSLTPHATGHDVHRLLGESWKEDPALTLKIIWNLRSIHEGKGEKKVFYRAFGWLYKYHPKTAIANLGMLVQPVIDRPVELKKKQQEKDAKNTKDAEDDEWTDLGDGASTVVESEKQPAKEKDIPELPGMSHGYYKDLLQILSLAAVDELSEPGTVFTAIQSKRPDWTYEEKRVRKLKARSAKKEPKQKRKRPPKGERGETSQQTKTRLLQARQDRLVEKLKVDQQFRALYIAVARIFASQLAQDLAILREATQEKMSDRDTYLVSRRISPCAKWAPSLGGSHDRSTNICTAIAQILQAEGVMTNLAGTFPVGQPIPEEETHRLRSYYRRWVISPLRRVTQVTEVYMKPGMWQFIDYNRVPSHCMQKYKRLFYKHDEVRFLKYLQQVMQGKRTISGATLLPHELLYEAIAQDSYTDPAEKAVGAMETQVVESQWRTLVDRLRSSGNLDNCIAVADVSGSMGSINATPGQKLTHVQPIWPCVALSILLAQLAKPPFNNTFITFSASPEIVTLPENAGLVTLARQMSSANWGMNTDLQAVFTRLILPLAVKHNIKKEDMIKRLFIFSDMEFDNCRSDAWQNQGNWNTDYMTIKKAYEDAGYDVPEIVFWNLAGATGPKPVTAGQEGVALMSGFSGSMLKVFMEGDLDAEEVAEEAKEVKDEMEVIEKDQAGQPVVVPQPQQKQKDPVAVMKKAVEKKSYSGLKVLD
jgi:hypothetical protein